MRLISLWEPWATLMALDKKRIETRSWRTSYVGWLAIQASKGGLSKRELFTVCEDPAFQRALGWEHSLLPFEAKRAIFRPGHIVAVVYMTGCYQTKSFIRQSTGRGGYNNLAPILTPEEEPFGDFSPGRFGWTTEKCFRLSDPIPFKAKQGLCDVGPSVIAQIRDQFNASRKTAEVGI